MKKPLITIVTIAFNDKANLRKTIESVIAQRPRECFEFIVVDGGSTDGSYELLKSYGNGIDVVISEKDNGISDAFNKGISLARGKYIQFLNAGDIFVSKDVISAVIPNLNAPVVCYQSITDKGNAFPVYKEGLGHPPKGIEDGLANAVVSHQATFVEAELYKNIGGYSSNYKLRMDLDFFYRAQSVVRFNYINEAIVVYDTGGVSSKLMNRLKFKLEEKDVVNLNSLHDGILRYMLVFYAKLPIYLLKKILSAMYYRVFK